MYNSEKSVFVLIVITVCVTNAMSVHMVVRTAAKLPRFCPFDRSEGTMQSLFAYETSLLRLLRSRACTPIAFREPRQYLCLGCDDTCH